MTNIFEAASRKKLSFTTTRGQISVDQLWDLPLKNGNLSLNSIAVSLKKKVSQTEDVVDLVDGDTSDLGAISNLADDKLRLDIVMHIITVLKAERDSRQDREAMMSELRIVNEALALKKQESLVSGTEEDIEKRRDEILAKLKTKV